MEEILFALSIKHANGNHDDRYSRRVSVQLCHYSTPLFFLMFSFWWFPAHCVSVGMAALWQVFIYEVDTQKKLVRFQISIHLFSTPISVCTDWKDVAESYRARQGTHVLLSNVRLVIVLNITLFVPQFFPFIRFECKLLNFTRIDF